MQYVLPLALLALFLIATLVGWRTVANDESDHVRAQVAVAARSWSRQASVVMNEQIWPLRWLAQDCKQGKVKAAEDFDREAINLLWHSQNFTELGWVDEHGDCTAAEPSAAEYRLFGNLANSPDWQRAIDLARKSNLGSAAEVTGGGDGDEVLLGCVFPVFSGDDANSTYAGAIIGEMRIGKLIDEIIAPAHEDYHFELWDGDQMLASAGALPDSSDAYSSVQRFNALDHELQLRVRPTPTFLQRSTPDLSRWMLFVGLLASLVVPTVVFLALRYRTQDAEQALRHAEALESLSTILSSVAAKLGSGHELLDQLADTARRIIHMKMAAVALLNEQATSVTFTGSSGLPPALARRCFPIDATPLTRDCIARNKIVVLEDAHHPDREVNAGTLMEYGSESMMVIPLVVADRVIGAMLLADDHPRKFNAMDRRLAAVWGAQASAILANHHLYECMDASLRAEKKLVGQLETLYRISTEMYRAGTLEASLQRVADQAPSAIGVDRCGVMIFNLRDGTCEQVAQTSGQERLIVERYPMKGTNADVVYRTAKPLILEDAAKANSIHPAARGENVIGSIMYLPLIGSDGRVLGLMTASRRQAGAFTEDQQSMATILATRATIAIETSRLHDSERRHADTQVILLRELNHRVKNNLASILALLTLDPPPLSPEARQWLDRAIERVSNMARAHELFTGTNDRVTLDRLLGQLLQSLAVVKPAKVRFVTDTKGVKVTLDSQRAVSLAMVLHEVCTNALVHGLRDEGRLEVTAREVEGKLRICVSDTGTRQLAAVGAGDEGVPVVHHGTGVGLQLVRGLVGRELKGRFTMMPIDGGGTLATVEFPLLVEETGGENS